MSDVEHARRALLRGETRRLSGAAVVLGAEGRIGRAFAGRLRRDGWLVRADPADPLDGSERVLLFDCGYRHGDPEGHVERVAGHLGRWRRYRAIFVPSSLWADGDSAYGKAKLAIERLADFYNALGAHVVTDRIGYFPGDGVAPDANEPFIGSLVTGDALYARVMARMLADV